MNLPVVISVSTFFFLVGCWKIYDRFKNPENYKPKRKDFSFADMERYRVIIFGLFFIAVAFSIIYSYFIDSDFMNI